MPKNVKDMVKHDCVKEKEFGELQTKVERVSKAVEGNGHEGLIITSIRLEETVKGLEQVIKDIKNSMEAFRTIASGFDKFQVEYTAMKVAETKHEQNRKWLVRTIIMLGSFLAAAMGFLFKKI